MTPRATFRLNQAGLFLALLALVVVTAGLVGLGAYWLIREDAWAYAASRADERVGKVYDKLSGAPPDASEARVLFMLLNGSPLRPPDMETGVIERFTLEAEIDPDSIYVMYPAGGGEPVWWPQLVSADIRDKDKGDYVLRSVASVVGAGGGQPPASADYAGRERRWPGSDARLLVFQKVEGSGPLYRRVAFVTLSTLIAMVLMSGLVLAVAQGRFWKRVHKLNAACEQIRTGGNLGLRVPADDDNALGLIGQNINRMLDEIEERGRLISTQDRFLDHDYRVPVTEIISSCNMLLAEAGGRDDATTQGLRRMLIVAKRMDTGLAERLELYRFDRDINRGDYSGAEQLSLREIVEEAIDGNIADAEARSVRIAMSGKGDGSVMGSRSLIMRALGNLIRNAVQHSAAGGQVDVILPEGAGAVIDVRDYGAGMSPDAIKTVTAGGMYLKSSTNGTGLGLAQVRGVMKAHKGEFTISNAQPGLLVRLKFLSAPGPER